MDADHEVRPGEQRRLLGHGHPPGVDDLEAPPGERVHDLGGVEQDPAAFSLPLEQEPPAAGAGGDVGDGGTDLLDRRGRDPPVATGHARHEESLDVEDLPAGLDPQPAFLRDAEEVEPLPDVPGAPLGINHRSASSPRSARRSRMRTIRGTTCTVQW